MPVEAYGRIVNGKLVLDNRDAFASQLREQTDGPVLVTVARPKSKRSLEQSAWEWGVALPLLAEHLGYDKHEHEMLHYAMVEKCFGARWDDKLKTYVPNARSSRLNTAEFSEYMEWFVRYAATEFHCVIPLPSEEGWEAA